MIKMQLLNVVRIVPDEMAAQALEKQGFKRIEEPAVEAEKKGNVKKV